jgi:uncharacterized membrane protein
MSAFSLFQEALPVEQTIFAHVINAINRFGIHSKWKEILVLGLFAIIFSLISLVNHYNFRTSALDLGMFNHALYSFSHGKMNYFTLDLTGNDPIYFADHFSPVTLLYAPFYYLFGSWTLLIIQILSILSGAIGTYLLALFRLPNFKHSYLFLILFLSQWAIVSALAFDFHNNVVASMFVPWFFYFYAKNCRWQTVVLFFLILICKENMSLWLTFILLGLMLKDGFKVAQSKTKNFLRYELILLIISVVYFYVVVSIVMPALSKGEAINQIDRFGHLGSSLGEIIFNVFNHPWDTLKMFFESTSTDPISYGIKMELHTVVLLSGGIAIILRPAYLIMLIPIYAQKLLSNDLAMWGINGQYSIEFTPIIACAFIDLLTTVADNHKRRFLLISSCIIAFLVNFVTLKERCSFWYDRDVHDISLLSHYASGNLDVKFIHEKLNEIPNEIPISVTSCFAPHLTNRDKLYHFPIIKDAEMIVLLKDKRSLYPLDHETFDAETTKLITSGLYRMVTNEKDLLVLKKNNSD